MTPKKYCPFTLGKVVPSYCIEKECAVFVNDTSCMKDDDDECEHSDQCPDSCKHFSRGYCGVIPS